VFEKNFQYLKTLAPARAELLAIVKADAYGHSLTLCAPAAMRAGARWLGVTSVEEALAARKLSPEARVVVMGGVFPGQEAAVVEHDLTPVLWERFQLDAVANVARATGSAPGSLGIFLEIDSGMSRQGVAPEELDSILPRFGSQSPLRMDVVTTHLYASDERNGISTTAQLTRLEQALTRISNTV